jgi:hypothetical protein
VTKKERVKVDKEEYEEGFECDICEAWFQGESFTCFACPVDYCLACAYDFGISIKATSNNVHEHIL